jgi:hypothetical protein
MDHQKYNLTMGHQVKHSVITQIYCNLRKIKCRISLQKKIVIIFPLRLQSLKIILLIIKYPAKKIIISH